MEQALNCLIVEDEPLAAEIIQDYIQQVSFLHLVAICEDALYATELLKTQQIDVLFLDIHLPKLRGLDFLKTLNHAPQVILTTAYQQYALASYEFNVVDYLLKPIDFPRFLQAVNKLTLEKPLHDDRVTNNPPLVAEKVRPFYFFNVNKERVKVYFDEITHIESLKEYIKIHTLTTAIVTKFQLGELSDLLPSGKFIRIHRSYMISLEKVAAYTPAQVTIKGKTLPIGRSYRENVMNYLASL